MAEHAGHARNRQRNLAADKIGGRLAAAAIRNVIELHAGHRAKQRGEQVLAAAVAGRRIVDLAGPRLGVGDQLLQGLHRQRRIDDDDARFATDQRDRREVVDRIESQVRIQGRTDRIGLRSQQQRVAVGRRLGDELAADRRSRAGLVLDEDRLPETLGQLLRDQAHRAVDRASRRKRHDDAHRPRRVVLRIDATRASDADRKHKRGHEPNVRVRLREHGILRERGLSLVPDRRWPPNRAPRTAIFPVIGDQS